MRVRSLPVVVCAAALAAAVSSCSKDEPAVAPPDYGSIATIRYSEHVQPLLARSCATAGCHDASTSAAGLSLATWEGAIRGSSFGEVLIPYRPRRSLLVTLFDGTVMRAVHPAPGVPALTNPEVQFLSRWIAEGAKNDLGAVPYAHSAHKLYVPNQAEDMIAVIDIDSLVVFRTIDVGNTPITDGPHFIVVGGDAWYVSLSGTQRVCRFDAVADTLVSSVAVEGFPALLALTPDGSKLYVSQFMNSNTDKIFVISTASMTVEKSIAVWTMPHGIRMDRAGARLYVANMRSDNISVIDVASDSVVATVPLAGDVRPFDPPKYMPMEVALTPDDSMFLVTCSETREVRMFSCSTLGLVDSFEVGDEPWHLQVTPDGNMCYVTNRRGNSVSAIHLPMRHVMETIENGAEVQLDYPHGCDVSPDGRRVFVSNENSGHRFIPRYSREFVGNVCVIDGLTNQIVKVLEVGRMPTGLALQH